MIRSSVQPSASAIIAIDSVKPDMPHAAVVHLLLELLGRQAGADLLLERQPPNPRVLNAVDDDAIDALADGGQHDRQRVHREARD